MNQTSSYKIQPNLLNALLVIVVYIIILTSIQKLSGVPYTEISKSSSNMLYGVLIPVLTGSIILTLFGLWSGWWKNVWKDKYQIKNHNWMHLFLILTVIAILANFTCRGGISHDGTFILFALIATALVGYSEELLNRGFLVLGARESGLTEIKVFLIVLLVFGGLHGVNMFIGQPIIPTITQMIYAGLFGGVYYAIFRKNGFLVIPMILHWMFDFSNFTSPTIQYQLFAVVMVFALRISFLLLIPAAFNFNIEKSKNQK